MEVLVLLAWADRSVWRLGAAFCGASDLGPVPTIWVAQTKEVGLRRL